MDDVKLKPSKLFRELFKATALYQVYTDEIQSKATTGSDGISRDRFEKEISLHINLIERKVKNQTYKFSPYIGKLILRNRYKTPRIVEKPTIRDKVTLRCIYKLLMNPFKKEFESRYLHQQINSLITDYRKKEYDNVMRFDVKDFFPSIDHAILLSKIRKRIKKKEIVYLINDAISNVCDIEKSEGIKRKPKGIAQGLSISNALSNIYLFDIDKKYEDIKKIKYYRFVDDILIICNDDMKDKIQNEIIDDFKKIKLSLYEGEEKFYCGKIYNPFDFLGYYFIDGRITVRKNSIDNIRNSIIEIFTSYKYSETRDLKRLLHKVNLRVTGCIVNKKKYGWLFYFSEMNDEKLLHSLDHFVSKQLKRVNIKGSERKKFVRAWHEINLNISNTNYIPNYDLYTLEQKKKLLDLYRIKHNSNNVNELFIKLIEKEIISLEKDIGKRS